MKKLTLDDFPKAYNERTCYVRESFINIYNVMVELTKHIEKLQGSTKEISLPSEEESAELVHYYNSIKNVTNTFTKFVTSDGVYRTEKMTSLEIFKYLLTASIIDKECPQDLNEIIDKENYDVYYFAWDMMRYIEHYCNWAIETSHLRYYKECSFPYLDSIGRIERDDWRREQFNKKKEEDKLKERKASMERIQRNRPTGSTPYTEEELEELSIEEELEEAREMQEEINIANNDFFDSYGEYLSGTAYED